MSDLGPFYTLMGQLRPMLRPALPDILLALYLSCTTDIFQRAQSIGSNSPFCFEWPRFLVSLLTRKYVPPAHEWPSTVINVKSGYARTNRSATIEHLLQNHISEPTHRGLTVTFLYTAQYPTGVFAADPVQYAGIAASLMQAAAAAGLALLGYASINVIRVTFAGLCLALLSNLLLYRRRKRGICTARAVPAGKREVVCITSGNGSTDAVVVVTGAGGAKLEDVAAGRAGEFGVFSIMAIAALIVAWMALLLCIPGLAVADAYCVFGIAALGSAHGIWAARTWRNAAALGFDITTKTVVHEDKVMAALMEAEEVEKGVGLALLPVFFPGPLRPKEEEWWQARKAKSL